MQGWMLHASESVQGLRELPYSLQIIVKNRQQRRYVVILALCRYDPTPAQQYATSRVASSSNFSSRAKPRRRDSGPTIPCIPSLLRTPPPRSQQAAL